MFRFLTPSPSQKLMRKPKPRYEETQVQQFSATIDSLVKQIHQNKNFNKQLAEFRDEADRTEKIKREAALLHMRSYKSFLEGQKEATQVRKRLERHERLRPGISSELHGYPNIPVTPELDRRQRHKQVQQEFKRNLDQQIDSKLRGVRDLNAKKLDDETRMIEKDNKALEDFRSSQSVKKEMMKSTLDGFWGLSLIHI